jgi:ABC-type tungstate transport system substrate-binding protein
MTQKEYLKKAAMITGSVLICIPLMAASGWLAMETDKKIRMDAVAKEQAKANELLMKMHGTTNPEEIYAQEVNSEDVD